MDRLTLRAPAKLNLRLRVGPLGEDGYHPLSSVMVALDGLSDVVRVARSASRRVTCPGIDGPANLAWRALDALEAEAGRPLPVDVAIDKAIPAQAGLGGGSSDAAAVLVATDRIHALGLGAERLEAIAARVGSDVPFFIRGGCQWARGRGEQLTPTPCPPFAALLMPSTRGLSTPAVYAAFDRCGAPAESIDSPSPDGFSGLLAWACNDLWTPALARAPWLGATARALAVAGAGTTLLCGSGSCIAGLFPDVHAAEAAARLMAPNAHPVVVTPSGAGITLDE